MFKKQLIAVLTFGLLSAALIAYSVVNVSGQSSSFENSGYVHVSASDNSNKRILFNSGTTYKKKVGDVISFSDSTGEQAKVDVNNFIHYDDSSVSSFVEGVLVDLDALSGNSAIDHYALAPNTVLSQSGSSYTILNSSENYSFKDVIWKISEDKYLLVSPSMKLRIGEDDERDISSYVEISYVGDSLIQIQTEDNVWQTISDDAHLMIDNGLDIDLSKKAIQTAASSDTESNVLLDFSRIVIDGEDNVEISPLVGTRNGETIIPHFNITAEDGADGINGTAGNNGAAGGSGQSGTNGNQGDDGHDGDKGAAGDTIDGDIKDFPVFTILNWTLNNNSCEGNIRVKEKLDAILDDEGHPTGEIETSMLAYYNQATDLEGGSIRIQDLSTGAIINPTSVSGDAGKTLDERFNDILNSEDQTIHFVFNGLQPDHSYLLLVDAITSYDGGTTLYLRPYISKTFWTDSLGIYAEAAHSTETSIGFDVVGLTGSGITNLSKVGYAVFDSYEKAAAATVSSLSGAISGNSARTGAAFTKASGDINYRSSNTFTTEGGLDINQNYYVRILYNLDGAGSWDGMTTQILEVPTLKSKAYIGTPILRENQNIFGFNVDPGIIRDEYSSFVNYSYEFYAYKTEKNADGSDKRDSAGNIILDIDLASGPLKAVTTKVHDTISVSVGNELRRGVQYCVRTVATFYDNEKYYTLTSGFSNPAMLAQSIKPIMYFVGNSGASEGSSGEVISGTYVKVDDYDSIHGRIVIQPGDGGAYLGLPQTGDSINSPTIVIKKDGYYYAQYPVYYSENASTALHPSEDNAYMLATVDSDNVVTIHLNDPLDTLYTANSKVKTIGGTQPTIIGDDGNPVPSTYEIILTGDVVDGTTVQSNVQIGRCEITVGSATPILATFTMPDDPDESKPLKNVALKFSAAPKAGLSTSEQNARNYNYEREKGSISTATSTTPGGEVVETYTTEIPGTLRSITIDLFGKTVDEKYLEEVTTYLTPGEEGYDDASNPEHIKDKYEYPDNTTGLLASRTLYRSNPEDDAIINKLFSSRGYILTERFFFPDTVRYSDDAVEEIFSSHPELTIYVKEAIDYAYGKASETGSETSYNGVQEKYSNINGEGKTLDPSTNKYFYANIFRAGNPSTNPNILLINKYDFNGTNRRACYITQTPTINPITDAVFEKFTYTSDSKGQTTSINAKASYDNMMKTLTSVTYYVYDAVDFYAGNKITVNGTTPVGSVNVATSYNYTASYNNGAVKTYQANKDITEWMNTSYPTKAGTYATPVHLDGLELAKITLNITYAAPVEGDDDQPQVPGTPEVKFIPMTRAAYADKHYAGDENMIPRIDPSSSADNPVYLFFLGDRVKTDGTLDTSFSINHFNDATKNAQLYESNGHQYVIAWTAQCTIPDTGEKLVYPFDSVVYASENYYTEAPYGDTTKYPYDLFATTLENNLMKECSAFTNVSYVTENGNAKFGNDAYMLVPHSTISQNNFCLDMERLEPEAHAMLYEADSSGASSTLTIRATLYDFDKAVVRKNADSSHADYKKALYYRSNGTSTFTNNITGDLFISDLEPKTQDADEMNDLYNKATGVSEIKVTKDNSATSNTTSAVVAVQRYNDKYTTKGEGVHASASSGYLAKSDDSNWTMKNNSNARVLKKYFELFTTEFNGAEKENEAALQGYFATQYATKPIKGTFYWKANATNQIDKGVMAIEGPTDIMKRVAGFRIYFTKDGETFYVDKLLPSMDTPEAIEGGMEFFQFQKYNEGTADETLRVRFNISLALEILKIGVPVDKRIKGDASKTIVNHAYPNFNGKKNIQVSFDLLYPSTKSGYKYIENSYRQENGKYYSDETFSLKQLTKGTAGDSDLVTPITRRDYLALNTNYNSTLTYSTSAGYSSNELNTLGSFFYLRLSKNSQNRGSLGVESTRHWTTNNVNPMMASRTLTTDVNSGNATSLPTMTQLIPVLTGTINNGGTPLPIDSYEYPCLPFTDDPDVVAGLLRNGGTGADGEIDEASTIDTPKANPYVGYSNGKSTVSSIGTNIGYVEMEDDEYVYFTLSQRVPNNFFDNHQTVKLYKITGTEGQYNTGWIPYSEVTEVNMTLPERYTSASSPNFSEGGAYEGLAEYFAPVKMSDQEDPSNPGSYSTLLKFAQLASNKQYSIICWRYVQTQGGYALIPAEMIDSNGIRVNNHCDIETKELPKPQPFTLTYSQPTDVTKKLMYENFELSGLPGPDDEGYEDEYYTIIEIQSNAPEGEENEFITYLSLTDTLTTSTETFDADGVVDTGTVANTKFINKYTRDELNGTGGLKTVANRPLSDDIKYGTTYNVMFRTYKKGEGPAYMNATDLAAYDWTNDPLSIFVDRTTIDQDNYINNTPTKTFTPSASLDSIGTIVPTTNLSTKAESYFSFIVGGLNSSSGSTRNMAVLPIAIWEHLPEDGGATEYYDVTRFLQYTSDSQSGKGNDGNFHALEKGAVLKMDFATIETDEDGNESSKQIFAKDENIHVFLYSRQLGEPLNLTESGGTVQGCILGEEALKNSKQPTTRVYIEAKDYFAGRGDFEPYYSTNLSNPKEKSITPEQFTLLSIDLYKPAASVTTYNVGSRLLRKNFAKTQDTDITVGEVKVTPLGSDFQYLSMSFKDHKLFNEIDYMTYELIYHTKYKEEVEEDGVMHLVEKEHEYYLNGTPGVATKDTSFGGFADEKEGVSQDFSYPLNIGAFITDVRNNKMNHDGRIDEEDCRLEIRLQFFIESDDGIDLPVSFSRASENKLFRRQILIDDDDITTEGEIFNKKLESNIYFTTEAEVKDTTEWINPNTGVKGWHEPENGLRYPPETDSSPFMSLLNNLNNFAGDLLDNLFGGNNNGK